MPEVSSTGSFPNFPRFRVDEEEKCDPSILTVLGEEVYWRRDLKIYPNPVTAYVTVEIPDNLSGDIFMIDMEGKMVLHQSGFSGESVLDISTLVAGTYSLEFVPTINKDRVIYTQKMVKVE